MTKFKTEKRKAHVGERILITNEEYSEGQYRNGDVLTVSELRNSFGGVYVTERPLAPFIDHNEYEVIVDYQSHNEQFVLTRLFDAEAQIDELQRKVAKLEAQIADKPTLFPRGHSKTSYVEAMIENHFEQLWAEKKTPNQRRADVIKQAREYVVEHTKHNGRAGRNSGVMVGNYVTIPEFIVNAEKRTVVVLMKGVNCGKILAKGIAKCAPDDVFNADIGKAIALGRAKGVEIPQEFFNAPKPTEVVVGMVVKYFKDGGFKFTYDVSSHVLDTIRRDAVESSIWDVKIVDDTEAQYEVSA
ncbi:hypothetical protein [Sporosarcina koreensis]|uniref:hypothetical protein n=1 Tax=Sporosarcina koreensis TaxID=334735 RepID=UPI0007521083|nr:hypothetical protein [Sporosarcina koreensis]